MRTPCVAIGIEFPGRHGPSRSIFGPADRHIGLVRLAQKLRLSGIAITDHNSVGGIEEAEAAAGPDFLVLPAIEISTDAGHVLAYGVREAIPRNLSVADTVERIVALGGVPVAAH